MRPRAVILVLLCCGVLLGAAPAAAGDADATSKTTCGTAVKFGHEFDVRVGGDRIDCGKALEVIDRTCKFRPKQDWSCFSFQAPYPFIVWFPSKELFERDWSTVIIYKRYPCSEALLTRDLFAPYPKGFPSLRHLLADDIIRCGLLEGMTYEEVRRLLGPPDGGEKGSYLRYVLGLEREFVLPDRPRAPLHRVPQERQLRLGVDLPGVARQRVFLGKELVLSLVC